MRNASKKKLAPVAPKKTTIRLFDDESRIKLPVAQNPVHKLHALLEREFSGRTRLVVSDNGTPLRVAGWRSRRG